MEVWSRAGFPLYEIEHSNDEIKGNVMFCQDPAVPHC